MIFDDKDYVIVAVTIIALFTIYQIPETAGEHLPSIITGLFGIAVGKKI